MLVAASCSTVLAMLAYASGGDTIQLTGECGPIEIKRDYDKPVIVDATRATVRGLRITGSNVDWRGGTLAAQDGLQGKGPLGYALYVSGEKITVSSVTLTDARIGAVVVDSASVKFRSNRFFRLRADGMNISATRGLTLSYNRFEESKPNPTTCYYADGRVEYGVAQRDCPGAWADGDHPDAVQMRNGVADAVLDHNVVYGNTQGLAQMDTTGDAPLANVRIWGNVVRTTNYHPITLGKCSGCLIDGNTVQRGSGSAVKAIILQGEARRCGNIVPDQPGMDPAC